MTHTRQRAAALAIASVVTGTLAAPQPASAATGATLYVNNASSFCTDSGTGTQAAPYCTLQAAANAATAGDTVMVGGGHLNYYSQPLTIPNSGTATAPITFEPAAGRYFVLEGEMAVSGSYIDIEGVWGAHLDVTGSHVTVDRSYLQGESTPTITTGAGVVGLTVERSQIYNYESGPGILLGSGNSGTVLSTDEWSIDDQGAPKGQPAIVLSGDTNTDITSNTVVAGCGGISVTESKNTVIENNILAQQVCPGQSIEAVDVDTYSAPWTTENYNVLPAYAPTNTGTVVPYAWGSGSYTTQADFTAATGQGAADAVEGTIELSAQSPTADSYAVGSGDASAPGELDADIFGNSWGATPDRGAARFAEFSGAAVTADNHSSQQVEAGLDLQGVAWGQLTETIDWGDGSTTEPLSQDVDESQESDFSDLGQQTHMYAQRGTYTISITLTDAAQTITRTATVTTSGGTFVPVAPTRVLDTRHGVGAPQAQVKPNASVSFDVTKGVSLPADLGTITAVVMNVTATDSSANGFVTAYPTGGAVPKSSNLNFLAHQNVPNLVTVAVNPSDRVSLLNSSSGSSDLIADVAGYYVDSSAGGYYQPNTPKRVLDTRNGTGGVKGPVAAGGSVSISVPQCTAVAVNVTVVSPTANGVITAYPDQGAVPTASNLNYRTGQTVPNLVVVKVGADGKVDFKNSSTGTTQLIADLEGCYSASLGGAFVPVTPYRELDTRSGLGEESATGIEAQPNSDVDWWASDGAFGRLSGLSGAVMNITAVQGQASGVLTAYPAGDSVPTASNVNYSAGQTAANLAMVAAGQYDFAIHNNSKGKVQVIVDVFGYFS